MQSLRKTQSLFLKDFSKLKTQKFDVDIGGNVLNLILSQIFFKTDIKKLSFFFTLLGINVRTLNSKGTIVFTDIFSMGSANLGLLVEQILAQIWQAERLWPIFVLKLVPKFLLNLPNFYTQLPYPEGLALKFLICSQKLISG